MSQVQIVNCLRCHARCQIGAPSNPDARMLRRAKGPGLCVNCATHEWLINTYPVNMILANSGAAPLAYPHMREQFAAIMRVGRADANPDEINWNLISENWELPFPHKVKPSATNPCSQKQLDEIKSGEQKAFDYSGKAPSIADYRPVTSFEEMNDVEAGLGDKLRNLLQTQTQKGTSKMAKKKEGQQLDLIDVHPQNVKKIIKTARAYKAKVNARLALAKEEKQLKDQLIDVVEVAGLQPLEGGVIKFQVDMVEIKVTPRDKLVQVKELDPTE